MSQLPHPIRPSAPTRRRICEIALAALPALRPAAAASPQSDEVTLFAYHLKPPFLTNLATREGLYFDLAELLSLRVPGLRFRTEYLPRRRLEQELAAGRLDGLVLGVHPTWFKDPDRKLYLWTPPFMRDADVVVSRHERPVTYEGPESLAGLRMALPRGYYYYGVDELVRAGRIQRTDSESEETALMMMSLGRADASIITRRTLYALIARRPGLRGKFHVAAQPHDEFDRHILVPRERAALHKPVSDALSQLVRDPAWQTRLLER